MWRTHLTHSWNNDQRYYAAENGASIAPALANLHRYLALLKVSANHKNVEAEYLRIEASGIVSIGQEGLATDGRDIRIYAFPDDTKRSVYLLGITPAINKHADMECYRQIVYAIVEGITEQTKP